jgi:hypothetical protein
VASPVRPNWPIAFSSELRFVELTDYNRSHRAAAGKSR